MTQYKSWLKTFTHQISAKHLSPSMYHKQLRNFWFFSDNTKQEQKLDNILDRLQALSDKLDAINKQPQNFKQNFADLAKQMQEVKKHLDDEKQKQEQANKWYKRWGKGLLGAGVTAALVYAFEDYIDEVLRLEVVKRYNFGEAQDLIFGQKQLAGTVIRQDVLKYLDEEIKEANGAIKQIAIIGESGLGKSEIAQQFISYYSQQVDDLKEDKPHWHIKTIAFFDAQYPEILEEQYRKFALELGIDDIDISTHELKTKVDKQLSSRSTRWWLNEQTHQHDNWVLIFDNVKDAKLIEPYLPKRKQNGIVIYTSNKSEIFTNREISFFNLQQTRCRLNDQQAMELFDLGFGEGSSEIAAQEKVHLANRLQRLPGAILQASAYIGQTSKQKNPEQATPEQEIPESIRTYLQRCQGRLDKIEEINKVVAKLAFEQLEDTTAQRLVNYFTLLNSEKLEAELMFNLMQHIDKKIDYFSFSNMIQRLENYRLLQRTVEGSFRLNANLRHLLADNKDKSLHLQDLLSFTAENLCRDNSTLKLSEKNGMFLWHLAVIEQHLKDYSAAWQDSIGEHFHEFMYAKLAIAGHYASFARPRKAQKELTEVKTELECYAGQIYQDNTDWVPDILHALAQKDRKLPTLYATTLYSLGRTCFYLNEVKADSNFYKYLKQAQAARKAIDKCMEDKNASLYDDFYNEKEKVSDTILIEVSGLLQFLIMENTSQSLTKAEGKGEDLLEEAGEEEFKKKYPNFEKSRLHLLLVDLYYRKAKLATVNDRSIELMKGLIQALSLIPDKEDLNNSISIEQDLIKLIEKVHNNIDNRLKGKTSEIHESKHYKAVGDLLVIEGSEKSRTKAYRLFNAAINEEQEKTYFSHTLANAYLGLAKYYGINKPEQALRCINKCIKLQKLSGMAPLQQERLEAEALKLELEAELAEKIYTRHIIST